MIEITLAVLSNIKCLAHGGVALGLVATGLTVFFIGMLRIDPDRDERTLSAWLSSHLLPKEILFTALCAVLGAVPSVDDIWKVRIGLIKLQLASPENIQKGADVIERIGQKLECKYLGCEEKK